MVYLNYSYDDLCAVISVAISLMHIDGEADQAEAHSILKSLTDQYNFEDKQDLLESYIEDAKAMDSEKAVGLIQRFDVDGKQFASNFFANVILADGKVDPAEEETYKALLEVCDLPIFQKGAIHQ